MPERRATRAYDQGVRARADLRADEVCGVEHVAADHRNTL